MADKSKNKQKNPKVSIITIVYNGEEFLECAIKSIEKQTYKNIEYIVIDGGSKDGTLDIIRKHKSSIDSFVSEPDEGISDAFNKGVKKATGDIIGILNSDDWYEPDTVENVVNAFLNNPQDDIMAGCIRVWERKLVGKKQYTVMSNTANMEKWMSLTHPATFIKKKVYDDYGYYRKDIYCAMDYELCLRFFLKGVKIGISESIAVNMRAGGVSAAHRKKTQREVLKIKNEYFGKKPGHYLFYVEVMMKGFAGSFLKAAGLKGLLVLIKRVLYRKNKNVKYEQ